MSEAYRKACEEADAMYRDDVTAAVVATEDT